MCLIQHHSQYQIAMNTKIVALVAGVLGLIGITALVARNKVSSLANFVDFKLKSIKIGKVSILTTTLNGSVLISNGTTTVVSLTALKVELIRLVGTKKEVLGVTPTSKLVIPANSNIAFETKFNISNSQLISMIGGAVSQGLESQLKGKISIRIKCEVMKQYVEQEIPFI